MLEHPRLLLIPLIALVMALFAPAVFLLALKDSGDEEAPAASAPGPSPQPVTPNLTAVPVLNPVASPTPAVTPTPGPQSLSVRWQPDDSLIYNGPVPDGGEVDRLFWVRLDGTQLKLLETPDLLSWPQWLTEGPLLLKTTQRVPPQDIAGYAGFAVIDFRSGAAVSQVNLWQGGTPYYNPPLIASKDGGWFAFYDQSPQPAHPSGAPFMPAADPRAGTVIVSSDGRVMRLMGLGPVSPVSWTRDGRLLVSRQAGNGFVAFVVPTAAGSAIRVAGDLDPSSPIVVSPAKDAIAYMALGSLRIDDLTTGDSRILAPGRTYRFASPRWSPDGRFISAGSDVIEVATGDVTEAPTGIYTVQTAVSPNGRYVLATDEPWGRAAFGEPPDETACSKPSAPPYANRTYLIDRETGTSRLLLDCQAGFFPYVRWLGDNRHFEAQRPQCWACDGGSLSSFLVDSLTGAVTPLVAPGQPSNTYASPDGTRILVTGRSLRLVGLDGAVIWELPADSGRVFKEAAWAPDGLSYVFTTGPTPP